MRCPRTTRLLTVVAAALMLFSSLSVRSYAVACDCSVNITRTVDICLDDSTYSITVSFCETNYTAPFPAGNCTTFGQDRISKIKKICFNGPEPLGYTNVQIISALYCAIKNTGCNPGNPWGFSVPIPPGSVYCWQIQAPKCTKRDINRCIIPCGDDCKWCYYEFRWFRSAGACVWSPSLGNSCSDAGGCVEGCETGCPTPEGCCE